MHVSEAVLWHASCSRFWQFEKSLLDKMAHVTDDDFKGTI